MYKIQDSLLETKLKKTKSDNLFLLVIAFLLSLMLAIMLLSNYVFLNVQVLGPSMEPTLQSEDVLIANRIKTPKRYSIIIIKGEKEDWLIKRVIGVGGDTVKIEGGYVYVNGELIDEPYLKKQGITYYPHVTDKNSVQKKEWQIKEGEIFYLGDNRTNSSDSRYEYFGTCTENQVVGVVENWSIGARKFLKVITGNV